MMKQEIDSASRDLKEKSFAVKIDELNNLIKRNKFYNARVIPKDKLETSEKECLFKAAREKVGMPFNEVIDKIYKIKCTKLLYEPQDTVRIYYLEK